MEGCSNRTHKLTFDYMKITKKKFPNGMRFVGVNLPESKTVTVQVFVRVGAEDEKKGEEGLAHFIEHMCFKGTVKRPTALSITREIESLGAQVNAYTNYKTTSYYIKGSKSHIEKIIDIISDIYNNPLFPETEIEKEKGVVIEEINMYNDQPDNLVDEDWQKLYFEKGRYTCPIGGTKETVSSFTREHLISFFERHYIPHNTVFVVSGTFNEKKVIDQIKKSFFKKTHYLPGRRPLISHTKKPIKHVVSKKTDQAHLVMGVPACTYLSDERYPTYVLSTILGVGMSSRLFHLLREEMGVAYYVYSQVSIAPSHGVFKIYAGVDKNRVKEVIEKIQLEVKRIVHDGVSDEELSRAKEYMAGEINLGLESSDDFSSFYGNQEVHGLPPESPKQKEKKMRSVTKSAVLKVAKKLFKKPFVISLIGDFPPNYLD